ncbi:uncharacterized protein G2W53_014221 [Senna tora]|uniref:Uncharacterized protein n=1 Tax=Senna tora TaxID=362788 RepID=A0A834WT44_9FABA|nr:uncharacterized protein G2W53_014221 [Senna tora]
MAPFYKATALRGQKGLRPLFCKVVASFSKMATAPEKAVKQLQIRVLQMGPRPLTRKYKGFHLSVLCHGLCLAAASEGKMENFNS